MTDKKRFGWAWLYVPFLIIPATVLCTLFFVHYDISNALEMSQYLISCVNAGVPE